MADDTGQPSVEPEKPAEAKKPEVQFLSDKPRSRVVTLMYPLTVDGVEYRTITVRRLSVADVRRMVEAASERMTDPGESMVDVPAYVLELLDDDDAMEVDNAVRDFLPARFRALLAALAPEAGGT